MDSVLIVEEKNRKAGLRDVGFSVDILYLLEKYTETAVSVSQESWGLQKLVAYTFPLYPRGRPHEDSGLSFEENVVAPMTVPFSRTSV